MLTVNHTASASGGSFSAGDGGLRMGDLSYEWASPEVFAIMHTVVEEAFRGQGVAKALLDAAFAAAITREQRKAFFHEAIQKQQSTTE